MRGAAETGRRERGRGERVLLGAEPRRSVRLLAAAGALFVGTFVLHLPARYVGPLAVGLGFFLPFLVALALCAAAAGAYLNDGLLVSVALAGGVGYGFYLPLVLFDLASPNETALWALGAGSGFAVVLGGVGFAAGALLRRLARRVRTA